LHRLEQLEDRRAERRYVERASAQAAARTRSRSTAAAPPIAAPHE
jgi:hypothetical protein